jgi:hypothetical protein
MKITIFRQGVELQYGRDVLLRKVWLLKPEVEA